MSHVGHWPDTPVILFEKTKIFQTKFGIAHVSAFLLRMWVSIVEVLSIPDFTNFSVFSPINLRFAKIIKLRWHLLFYTIFIQLFLPVFWIKNFKQEIFWPKFFWPKICWQIFSDLKFFDIKNFQNKIFLDTKFFGPKISWPNFFSTWQIFWPNFFFNFTHL